MQNNLLYTFYIEYNYAQGHQVTLGRAFLNVCENKRNGSRSEMLFLNQNFKNTNRATNSIC